MTQIEKAHAWFKANDYEVESGDCHLSIQVWNNTLEDSITVYLDMQEIQYRAELWDEQLNKTQSC
jgi:hypothetical protein